MNTENLDDLRRLTASLLNLDPPTTRYEAEQRYGQVWDTSAMLAAFDVIGFAAPLVAVVRKADGCRGVLAFTHNPRWYFEFVAEADAVRP